MAYAEFFLIGLIHITAISSQSFELTALNFNLANGIIISANVGSAFQTVNLLLDFSSPFSYLLKYDSNKRRGLAVNDTSSIKFDGLIIDRFPNSIFDGELATDTFQINNQSIELSFFLIGNEPLKYDTGNYFEIRIDGVLGMHDFKSNQSVVQHFFNRTKSNIITFKPEISASGDSVVKITIGTDLDMLDTSKSCRKSQFSKWSCIISNFRYKLSNAADLKDIEIEEPLNVIWRDEIVFFEATGDYDPRFPESMTVSNGFFERLIRGIHPCDINKDLKIDSMYSIIHCDNENISKTQPMLLCMSKACLTINLAEFLRINSRRSNILDLTIYFNRKFIHGSYFNKFMLQKLGATISFDYSKNLIYFDGKNTSSEGQEILQGSISLFYLLLVCIPASVMIAFSVDYFPKKNLMKRNLESNA